MKNGLSKHEADLSQRRQVRSKQNYPVLLILILGLFWVPLKAQNSKPLIEVNSAVDTSVITIGDRIKYTLSIKHKNGMRVEQPGAGVNLGQFEIKDYTIYESVKEDDYIFLKYEYIISVFDTGTFTIPPFPVAYFPTDSMGTYKIIEASPVNIYVRSVIQDDKRELRDIKPPVQIPYNYLFLGSMIAIAILLAVAGYFGYNLYKRRKEQGYLFITPAPPLPAHETALEALETLLEKKLLEQGAYKDFYSEISEIVRRYIEGRYFVQALEETSYEIIRDMQQQDLTEELYQLLKDFLALSDLVKFARYIPDQQENDRVIQQARRFIDETKIIMAAAAGEVKEQVEVINQQETTP